MKDYTENRKIIADVIGKLDELGIDLYLIITAEGCDPMTEFIPGVDTVGSGAFMFTRDGRKLATASSIDAQDVEESGLFDEVIRYDGFDATLARIVRSLAPRRIAFDFSETEPFCDGLTMGKYARFVESMGDWPFEAVSCDLFMPAVRAAHAG
ncbi:MAG: hypothetical protein IJH78_08305 [Clostridia bacterium]|nr:hypothetical protein [Clostridia bacterium]